jgi:hypothetical protein
MANGGHYNQNTPLMLQVRGLAAPRNGGVAGACFQPPGAGRNRRLGYATACR